MPRIGLIALTVVFGVAGAGLIGCGGDSESTSESASQEAEATGKTEAEAPPEVTKDDYIAAADELCDAVRAENLKLAKERAALAEELASTPSTETAKNVQDIVEELADNRRELTKELKALEEPASGGADAYLESRVEVEKKLDASAKAWGAYADALDEPTATALNEAVEAESKSVEANAKLAEKYGFETCGTLILKQK